MQFSNFYCAHWIVQPSTLSLKEILQSLAVRFLGSSRLSQTLGNLWSSLSLDVSNEQNPIICGLVTVLFPLAQCLPSFSMLFRYCWIIFLCTTVPHFVYLFTSFCVWFLSVFWLLWIILLLRFMDKIQCGYLFLFLFDIAIGEEIAGLYGNSILIIWCFNKLLDYFPKQLQHFTVPGEFQFLITFLLSAFLKKRIAIYLGLAWYLSKLILHLQHQHPT